MVSRPDFANSLTISNAASSHYALAVMTVVAAIFTPLVLLYQGWTYHVFRPASGRSARGPAAGRPCRWRAASRQPAEAAMRALDPRLLRRSAVRRGRCSRSTRARTRPAIVLVLLQATLLARIVARAFARRLARPRSAGDIALLALAFAARGVLAWAMEVGRPRAARGASSPSCGSRW